MDKKYDLTVATAATINDLRLAFQTQKLYERDARVFSKRYTTNSNSLLLSIDFPTGKAIKSPFKLL